MIPKEFRQILAELELCSNGTTYSWSSSGGGKAGSRAPVTGDDSRPWTTYRDEYLRASTDEKRLVVQDQALAHLRRLQGRYERPKAVGESPKQWKERLIREGESFEPQIVARQFNTTAKIVMSVRIEFDRSPGNGRPLVSDGEARVIELYEQGASLRQIEKLTKVPYWQVHRIVKTAA